MRDSSDQKKEVSRSRRQEFVEGTHFYYEDGLMVLTETFLLERGYCCENGCRHCPYTREEKFRQSR